MRPDDLGDCVRAPRPDLRDACPRGPHARLMAASTRAVLTALLAALVAVASLAQRFPRFEDLDEMAVVGAAAVLALLLAIGWPVLLRLPNPLGSGVVIALGGVGAVLTVTATKGALALRQLPVVLALAILLAFVNELARQDGRRRLVDSVAGTVTGLLVATAASGWVASERMPGGSYLVVAGAVSLAFASFVSFGAGVSAVSHREWATAVATTAAGVVSGAAAAAVMPDTSPLVGAFLGLGTGMLIAALDALFHRLPALRRPLASLAAIVLPVAVTGILVYVVGRVLAG